MTNQELLGLNKGQLLRMAADRSGLSVGHIAWALANNFSTHEKQMFELKKWVCSLPEPTKEADNDKPNNKSRLNENPWRTD